MYRRAIKAALILVSLLFLAVSALALDLGSAKSQGLVGETTEGYLAPVKPGNAQADQLIRNINDQRRKQYQQIATRNKTTLQAVEQLAGKKAIEKTPAGQFIRINGAWKKK